jgi:hypothetical protein
MRPWRRPQESEPRPNYRYTVGGRAVSCLGSEGSISRLAPTIGRLLQQNLPQAEVAVWANLVPVKEESPEMGDLRWASDRRGSVNQPLTASLLDKSTMIESDLIIQEEATAPGPYALIVNDQVNISQGLAAAITALGVESSVCESVRTAIASFDKRRPDIIFFDVSLHQSEVIQLVEALRARGFAGTFQLM